MLLHLNRVVGIKELQLHFEKFVYVLVSHYLQHSPVGPVDLALDVDHQLLVNVFLGRTRRSYKEVVLIKYKVGVVVFKLLRLLYLCRYQLHSSAVEHSFSQQIELSKLNFKKFANYSHDFLNCSPSNLNVPKQVVRVCFKVFL